jgi:hypothetical protein
MGRREVQYGQVRGAKDCLKTRYVESMMGLWVQAVERVVYGDVEKKKYRG